MRATHLRWRNSEAYDERDNNIFDAWSGNVRLEDNHGSGSECASFRRVYCCIYGGISRESIISNLCVCDFDGNV